MATLDMSEIKGEGVTAIPCAFINSMGPPISKGPWITFAVSMGDDQQLFLTGMRKYTYNHPSAPGLVVITVEAQEEIFNCKPSAPEYGVLYSFMQAANSMKFLMESRISLVG